MYASINEAIYTVYPDEWPYNVSINAVHADMLALKGSFTDYFVTKFPE